MLKSFLAVIGTAVLLTACSDDPAPTTPTTSDSYLATKTGSYYIQDNSIVAGTAAAPRDSATTRDSVVVKSKTTIEGKEAFELVTYNEAKTPTDTTYLHQDGSKVYLLFNMEYNVGGTQINLGKRWVLIADASGSSWTALKDSLSGVSIPYAGTTVTANAGILFTGTKGSTETLTVNGSAVSAIKYTLVSNTMVYIPVPPAPIVIPVNTTIEYWFAKDIGLVKAYQAPFTVSMFGSAANIPGSRSTTVRYKVD